MENGSPARRRVSRVLGHKSGSLITQAGMLAAVAVLMLVGLTGVCACRARTDEQNGAQAQSQALTQRPTSAQSTRPKAPSDPDKFALIISGVGGEETYTKKFTGLATKLYETCVNELGFDAKNTFLLTEGLPGDPENAVPAPEGGSARRSTAEEVRKAFEAIKAGSRQGNLVFIMLIGHGSFDSQQAKFNLIGPDLAAKDYAQLLSGLAGRRVVFVNSASCSGEFVKPLSGPDRIIITATRSGNEQNATVFAEHFIAGLVGMTADADKNGRLSVYEAFNYATTITANWYKDKNRLATEHALIDDNGDGVGHEDASGGDGNLARVTYLDSKPIGEAGGDAELARLIGERQKLEEAVEKLKARKDQMKAEEYETELEKLLVELAKVNQAIKSHQKK